MLHYEDIRYTYVCIKIFRMSHWMLTRKSLYRIDKTARCAKRTEINTLSRSLVIYQAGSATKSGRLLIMIVDVGYNGEGRNIERR